MKETFWTMLRDRLHRRETYSRADFWDRRAEGMTADEACMWRNPHVNRRYHREQWAFIRSVVPSLEGKRVLDLGCGTGRFCREFARGGARVTGVDFSAKSLERARELSGDLPIDYVEASVFDLPDLGCFDVVLLTAVLALGCTDRMQVERALDQIEKCLGPNSTLVVLEPLHTGFLRRSLTMSSSDFMRRLEQHGLTIETTRPLHCWPVRLGLAYIRWGPGFCDYFLNLGEAWLRRFPRQFWGDYVALVAVRDRSGGSGPGAGRSGA